MWEIYQRSVIGKASINEIFIANKIAIELLKGTIFTSLAIFPGTVFILPIPVLMARDAGIDIVPTTISKQFSI